MISTLLLSALLAFNGAYLDFDGEYVEGLTYEQIETVCKCAAEKEGIYNPSDNLIKIKDLADNEFYVQIGNENGMMVYDPISFDFIEKSVSFICPYDFYSNEEYYYFGPMSYYVKDGNSFRSLLSDEVIIKQDAYILQEVFSQQLLEFRNAHSPAALEKYLEKNNLRRSVNVNNKTYINNYQFVRNSVYPENNDDSCGFVAASIVLNYWENTMHRGTILPQYLDDNHNLNTESGANRNIKDRLVQLAGGNTSSWGLTIRDALINYCSEANVSASSQYYIGKIGLDNELSNNRPAIIFGALPNYPNSNLINHAVVAYGVQNEWWGGYYIVNYGWDDSSVEVSLGFGFVGSVTLFQLDENFYKTECTVHPSDYGFPNNYCPIETNTTIIKNGLSFTTSRLRTGYIEDEYINLSPRKEGYGTAFLEYEFINPVYQVEIDISFWSSKERYNSWDYPIARIEYRNLDETIWNTTLDLLNCNLSTDRHNQSHFTLFFPCGTRNFRIYTHFESMSGLTDRNKGRISIGDMKVFTYR